MVYIEDVTINSTGASAPYYKIPGWTCDCMLSMIGLYYDKNTHNMMTLVGLPVMI